MDERLLTANDVARYLNVKVSTIRYWVHTDYIPHIKFKGAVRFFPSTIREWMETLVRRPIATMSKEVSGRITTTSRKEVA